MYLLIISDDLGNLLSEYTSKVTQNVPTEMLSPL